jgi:hypothetical protein
VGVYVHETVSVTVGVNVVVFVIVSVIVSVTVAVTVGVTVSVSAKTPLTARNSKIEIKTNRFIFSPVSRRGRLDVH